MTAPILLGLARALLLRLELALEAREVDGEAAVLRQLLGEVERQAVGVVEPERVGARDGSGPAASLAAISSNTANACLSVVPKRSSSTATTRATDSWCATQLGIRGLHALDDRARQLGQEAALDPELLPVAQRRAA